MGAGYVLAQTAENDLRGILEYIAEQDGVDRALHVHGKFLDAFEALADTPGMGFKRHHLTGELVRWHVVFRFLVIYDPDSRPLTILRVLHGARDLDHILAQDP